MGSVLVIIYLVVGLLSYKEDIIFLHMICDGLLLGDSLGRITFRVILELFKKIQYEKIY